MTPSYQPLPVSPSGSRRRLFPAETASTRPRLRRRPAVRVMTDLSQVTAYTTELDTPLSKALETMVKRGYACYWCAMAMVGSSGW